MNRPGCTSQDRPVCLAVNGRTGCPLGDTRVGVDALGRASYAPGSPWGGSRNSRRLQHGAKVSQSVVHEHSRGRDVGDSSTCGPTKYGPAMVKSQAACAAESDTPQHRTGPSWYRGLPCAGQREENLPHKQQPTRTASRPRSSVRAEGPKGTGLLGTKNVIPNKAPMPRAGTEGKRFGNST
jgi:hypothetical protein